MNVGDYVRTEKGILKIRDDRPFKDDKNKLNYLTYGNYTCVLKENIIKSSQNIIDLIEVGDYVNSYYVEDVRDVFDGEDTYTKICLASGCNYFQPDITEKEDIKSIVTKEQFESMKYEVN